LLVHYLTHITFIMFFSEMCKPHIHWLFNFFMQKSESSDSEATDNFFHYRERCLWLWTCGGKRSWSEIVKLKCGSWALLLYHTCADLVTLVCLQGNFSIQIFIIFFGFGLYMKLWMMLVLKFLVFHIIIFSLVLYRLLFFLAFFFFIFYDF
jgi:hypothetical protein